MSTPHLGTIALLSGFCGIAYEILFMRLMSTFLGEMFYVGAAVLASFLLAFGLGALHAWRFVRWLWIFEICIGAYAALLAMALYADPLRTLEWLAPVAGYGPLALIATVIGLLAVPAAMIGFSVPMFTLYAAADPRAPSRNFNLIYAAYNLGGALCVLALEYLLLRALGIAWTTLALSLVNLMVGLLLRTRAVPAAPPPSAFSIPGRLVVALALSSVASGIWQLLLFKFAEQAFGPFHENFALVVALCLTGLFCGTLLATRLRARASTWMIAGALALAVSFAAVNATLASWAWLNDELGWIPGAAAVLKLAVLSMLGGLPLLAFGAAVPVMLREVPRDEAPAAGRLLAISSFGNVAGYLGMVFLLYERLDYRGVTATVCLLLMVAGIVLLPAPRRFIAWAAPAAALGVLGMLFPARTYFDYGYDNVRSPGALRLLESLLSEVETVKRFDNRVDILRTRSGHELIYINGYQTMATVASGRTNFREVVFGLTPALYAGALDDALVLGLGTGITAGATASIFRRTTAVDVNPALVSLLPRFSRHNFDIVNNPRAELALKDAITALTESDRTYDAIVNTVTSPLYFSSAKLYTREFFRLAASRLKPDGVYALWFDTRVTEAGARVIFQTLKASFGECHLIYIASGYMQVICGNHRLVPRPLPPGALDPRLRTLIAEEAPGFEPSAFLLSLAFPDNAIHRRDWQVAQNTLDRPVLEFLMSRVALRQPPPAAYLRESGADLRRSALASEPLGKADLARRCLALRMLSASFDCTVEMAKEHGNRLPRSYTQGVLSWLEDRLMPSDHDEAFALLENIVDEARPADAPLVERWVSRLAPARIRGPDDVGRRFRCALLLAKHYALTGHPVSDELVAEVARVNPMEPSALETLAYVAVQRGNRAAAEQRLGLLAWSAPMATVKAVRARMETIGRLREIRR